MKDPVSPFPLLTDEHVQGPLLKGLIRVGWDVQRVVDVFGEKTDDEILFEYAAKVGRVFVTNDEPAEHIAIRWLKEGRPFRGLICWTQKQQQRMKVGEIIEVFQGYASGGDPFANYPIIHIKLRR